MELEFYLKYGLLLVILISVFLTILLYKILIICKGIKKFKIVLAIFFIVFFVVNFFLIYVANYEFSLIYQKILLPAICISLSTTIFLKPIVKEKNR
ncbi:MAG: hypothetical protein K0R54_2565 [Clostridiaceae bacterium]|jgi:hypothetical protein|nr:hypothetical protein [Clostridiaceae bacterium]